LDYVARCYLTDLRLLYRDLYRDLCRDLYRDRCSVLDVVGTADEKEAANEIGFGEKNERILTVQLFLVENETINDEIQRMMGRLELLSLLSYYPVIALWIQRSSHDVPDSRSIFWRNTVV